MKYANNPWDPQTWGDDPEPEVKTTSRDTLVVARKPCALREIRKGDLVKVTKGFDFDPESHKVLSYFTYRVRVAKGPAWEDHNPKYYEGRIAHVRASRAKA